VTRAADRRLLTAQARVCSRAGRCEVCGRRRTGSGFSPMTLSHILRRNCLLKQVIEGKIKGEMEVARRRGRRRKLLDDLKDRRGYSHLKEEALDRTMWRHRFGGGFGTVVKTDY